MSLNLQKKLDEQMAEKSGAISLSQCMSKHAAEFAKAASEKRLKSTNKENVEVFTGEGTRKDEPSVPTNENHYVKPEQL
ncbi:hypothetical protein TOT_010000535 [Theileria orientalis strain Shintoku]|uniref:Uncharacterized protein n=1 Tax=Theileria orientalis strain Shintoku TaxID=869250 RepID=J4C7I0_THEOR|nr:hypothetical protein TOT_010000535 [Theileria orientalis strain Shintoku]PVC54081.1 hypothetical protein MACL_00003338 [Theileria orientalis]BAM39073.1 hypothetical protein TOT_010000535 [Theileria orientalis strain Shintoku]|eukprot:XP_009689374.1 hypothetical protein TOT_010000535 [Theileria orientalis strain Shintoku]